MNNDQYGNPVPGQPNRVPVNNVPQNQPAYINQVITSTYQQQQQQPTYYQAIPQPINPYPQQQMPASDNHTLPLKIVFFTLLGVLVVVVILVIATIGNVSRFGLNDQGGGSDNNSGKTAPATSKSKYTTTIDYETSYDDVSLTSTKDVIELLKKDSDTQKAKCQTSNISEIENQIINDGVDTANLCELDKDLTKEIAARVKAMADKYPLAWNHLTSISLGNLGAMGAYAFAQPYPLAHDDTNLSLGIKIRIVINANIYLNLKHLDRMAKNDTAAGFHPKNFKPADVITHELGHYLELAAILKQGNITDTRYISNANLSKYNSVLYGWNKHAEKISRTAYSNYVSKKGSSVSFDDFRASISGYAVAKDDEGNYIYEETIAEAITDVMVNGDAAVDASKEVTAVFEKELKELK